MVATIPELATLDPHSAAALVARARDALLGRRIEEAAALLDRALLLASDCAEALALQGICWMQLERFDRAIEVFERARVVAPDLAMVYFNLGESYCRLGQFSPAEANLRQAIECSPRHFQAYARLSYVQSETGREKEAIRSMAQAVRLNPAFVEGYLALGSLCMRAGKREAALRICKAGIARNPDATVLRERLCALYALNGDVASAFREAVAIAEARSVYTDHLRVGAYAIALRQFDTAERAFQASLQLNPASWEGHYNLAELYMGADRMDKAREHYQAALDRNDGAYEPFNGMGLFVLLVDQDCDRSIGLLEQALALAPSRPEPRWNLALAYARKRDLPAAQRFAASVLPLVNAGDPAHHQAERLLATIRIEIRTLQGLK
jgi:tetratricopeptide (TPR) repeat protein